MFGWLRRAPSPRMEQRNRVSDALAGYPPYTPPPWWPTDSIEHAAYTKFFLANREHRLEALRVFLAKFNVSPDLDDAGVMAVSAWCPLYADLLVDGLETDAVWSAYHRFEAGWVGPLLGLNAMFDLGVYCGECVLLRNRRLKWWLLRGPEHNVAHRIVGQKYQHSFDPVRWMYAICKNVSNEKKWDEKKWGPRMDGRTQEDYLYRYIHAQATA
jgi:hypothetical protein